MPGVVYLGIILLLIMLNWFAFRFWHANYFLWYLKNGPIISLATGFLAPIWTRLKARIGLISAHPAVYVGACLQILGVFLVSLGGISKGTRTETSDDPEIGDGRFVQLFDQMLFVLLALVMTVLGAVWVLTVAPLGYFITLIAGVPARQARRHKLLTTMVSEEKGQVTIIDPQTASTLSDTETAKLSFAQDPFAVTQALTSLILFAANLIYSRLA